MTENTENFKSCSSAVTEAVKNIPVGTEFSGLELQRRVSRIYPKAKKMYTETLLRLMRLNCKTKYVCIDRHNSIYKRVAEIVAEGQLSLFDEEAV